MTLRPYQSDAIRRASAAIALGHRRVLLCAPCGAGKGHIAAELVSRSLAKGRRALFLAHRRELVLDLRDRIARHGIQAGVILPGEPDTDAPAQVASIQTLARRTPPAADLVIADECHRATAASWRSVLDQYPRAAVVGFSATPCRMSGAPLGDLFNELVQVTTPAALVEDGHLVPLRGWAFESPRLSDLPRTHGDFDTAALELVMGGSRILGSVVREYVERASGTQAICFCVSREHSRTLAAEFVRAGVAAEHLDGTASRNERDAAFARFRSGATRLLCNVDLFSEGVDLPNIETVILAAPTASLSRYLQRVGRGRRPLPCSCGRIPHWRDAACVCGMPVAKTFCRLHDHSAGVQTHGLPDEPRVWSLDQTVSVTKKQLARGIGSVRTCTQCYAIFAADLGSCPSCGAVNRTRRRLIRTEQGVAVPLEQVQKRREYGPAEYLRALEFKSARVKFRSPQSRAQWFAINFERRFHRRPTAADWAAAREVR